MLVFVSSPYRGDIAANVENARKYCGYVLRQGHTPIAPHLFYPQILNDNDPDERDRGIQCSLETLRRCDEIWIFGIVFTDGMQKEIDFARLCGIPMKFFPYEAGQDKKTKGALDNG